MPVPPDRGRDGGQTDMLLQICKRLHIEHGRGTHFVEKANEKFRQRAGSVWRRNASDTIKNRKKIISTRTEEEEEKRLDSRSSHVSS